MFVKFSRAGRSCNRGMPCFGRTPELLPELLAGVLQENDRKPLASRVGTTKAAASR
jgi:hypothetical protein